PYPGFNAVYKQFKTEWNKYSSFLKEENKVDDSIVNHLELTYIDHIHTGDLWKNINDIAKVINFFKRPITKEQIPIDRFNTFFTLSTEDGELTYLVRNGTKIATKKTVLVLELTMRKKYNINENFDSWFIKAHDHIAKIFIESLTKTALEKWGYQKK
ncbi:MAG: TIGR04255 family protein, partial [Halobacteriovoraceae bacterium]|nr:TIGR04255 family protein [Halobacteriovoraceae bacterium]